MMREAYVGYLNRIYACKAVGKDLGEDVSVLKIEEINSWFRAWTFMEACGFHDEDATGD